MPKMELRTQQTEIVNMCMIYKGNQVLVQNKVHKHNEWGGLTFPGGHVEAHESLTDAVIREVFEETGLTVGSVQLCGTKDWVNGDGSRYVVLFYKTDEFFGELKSSAEGDVFWMSMDELLIDARLASGMRDMIRVFTDSALSEIFYYKENEEWKYILK